MGVVMIGVVVTTMVGLGITAAIKTTRADNDWWKMQSLVISGRQSMQHYLCATNASTSPVSLRREGGCVYT